MKWRVLATLAVFVTLAGEASALQAVAEVKEDTFYTERKSQMYRLASLTNFYAPLPVFFEGWNSAPRTDIVDYSWNFGDGSAVYHGFNAAHVYETPGTFYARLTVTDKYGAKATSPSIRIDVKAPNGVTYYVDAVSGKDTNTGRSPSAAWKTATYAFQGMNVKRYQPGDRILFKRGQKFSMEAGLVRPSHYVAGYGYMFGAYGSGAKPIIQKVGASTLQLFKQQCLGLGHVAFQDLEFRLTSPEGIPASELFVCTMQTFNILFLRVDVKDMRGGIGINGGFDNYRMSGFFLKDCTFYDATHVQLFARCARLALLNNSFDRAGNHLNYLSYLDKAVIAGNTYQHPHYTRTALRISGATSYDYPTNNLCITDNWFEGYKDPLSYGSTAQGDKMRYTWQLVDLGPNKYSPQALNDIFFSRNTVMDGETLLVLGDVHGAEVSHNMFYTDDVYQAAYRIQLGSRFEQRPLKDIYIKDNTIISNEARWYYAGIIGLLNYDDPAYKGMTVHQNIQVRNNRIELKNSNGAAVIYVANPYASQLSQVKDDYNSVYTPSLAPGGKNLYMIGSNYVLGKLISIEEWRQRTGQGVHDAIKGISLNLGEPVL